MFFNILRDVGKYRFISAYSDSTGTRSNNFFNAADKLTNIEFLIKVVPRRSVGVGKGETAFLSIVEYIRKLDRRPFISLHEFLSDEENYYLIFEPPRNMSLRKYISNLSKSYIQSTSSLAKENQDGNTGQNNCEDEGQCESSQNKKGVIEKVEIIVNQIIDCLHYLEKSRFPVLFTPDSIFVDEETGKITQIYLNHLNSPFTFNSIENITNFMPPEFIVNRSSKLGQATLNSWMLGIFIYFLITVKLPFDSDSIESIQKNIMNEQPDLSFISDYSAESLKLISKLLMKNAITRMPLSVASGHSFYIGINQKVSLRAAEAINISNITKNQQISLRGLNRSLNSMKSLELSKNNSQHLVSPGSRVRLIPKKQFVSVSRQLSFKNSVRT
ncbi:hypothetical protein TRFO_23815 [Tritrichomonas foetus]|uniref:Protein kinase domain-containing protein n=1 Tax=Tritrichomonas foetus TaxID=1144522 RepID=A0A1J4K8P2_9EUKA|nr:hypothetical protein TRFO_23815 [Tritrichomonas foetus]|eukprot:OHT07865.1 hypothetical protein TRFO_23815 [Tritrichomonas foetus]